MRRLCRVAYFEFVEMHISTKRHYGDAFPLLDREGERPCFANMAPDCTDFSSNNLGAIALSRLSVYQS